MSITLTDEEFKQFCDTIRDYRGMCNLYSAYMMTVMLERRYDSQKPAWNVNDFTARTYALDNNLKGLDQKADAFLLSITVKRDNILEREQRPFNRFSNIDVV